MAEKAAIQFEVTVEGTYYAGTKNNKVHRTYKPEKFILSSLKDAQHTIYRKLISQRLMTKYPDFVGVRTCQIIDTKEITGAPTNRPVREIPINEMSLAELTQFSIEQGLAVDPQKCGSVMEARKAVSDALDDKQLLKRQQDEEAAKKRKAKEDKDALDDLSREPGNAITDEDAARENGISTDPLDQLGQDDPLKDLE